MPRRKLQRPRLHKLQRVAFHWILELTLTSRGGERADLCAFNGGKREELLRAFARPPFSFCFFFFATRKPVLPFLRSLFSKQEGEFNLIKCRSFLVFVAAAARGFHYPRCLSRMTGFHRTIPAYTLG